MLDEVTLAGISFLRPDILWAVPAGALALIAWQLVRRRRFIAFSAVGQLQSLRVRASPLRGTPRWLTGLASILIVAALMEPVLPYAESRIVAQGLDIVLVVDLSSSMGEAIGLRDAASTVDPGALPDPRTTRLAVTKQALGAFIERRRDDRIGLVVFASSAYVISPLTFDREYLLQYVNEISGDLRRETPAGHIVIESGTAIGEGIYLANALLARQSDADARNKVIVVFTDGEHNSGRDPVEALGETDAAGVRVHLVGIDLDKAVREKPPVVRLINTIAHYGGRYFDAGSARQLRAASSALAAVEKGRLVGRHIERNVPVFAWFATAALVLIVGALGLRTIPYFADLT